MRSTLELVVFRSLMLMIRRFLSSFKLCVCLSTITICLHNEKSLISRVPPPFDSPSCGGASTRR